MLSNRANGFRLHKVLRSASRRQYAATQVRDRTVLVAVGPDRNLVPLKFAPHLTVYMATSAKICWLCDLGHT
jgi:hypothetical protein